MTATIIMMNDTAHKIPAKPILDLKLFAHTLSIPLRTCRRRASTTRMRQIRSLVKLSLKQQAQVPGKPISANRGLNLANRE